ncbi:hypothetical protein [Dactylosporangium darangshiense]|uniref:hypothetical protein n=1 Tax=Dactylosporangium darangshiense TaxID=579108 RepID=UPI0036411A1F
MTPSGENSVLWHQTGAERGTVQPNVRLIDSIALPNPGSNNAVDSFLLSLRGGDAALNVRDGAFRTRMLLRTWEETDDVEGVVDLDFVLGEAPSADVIRRWLGSQVGLAVAVPPRQPVAEDVHRITLSVPARFVWTRSSGGDTFSVLDTRALAASAAVVQRPVAEPSSSADQGGSSSRFYVVRGPMRPEVIERLLAESSSDSFTQVTRYGTVATDADTASGPVTVDRPGGPLSREVTVAAYGVLRLREASSRPLALPGMPVDVFRINVRLVPSGGVGVAEVHRLQVLALQAADMVNDAQLVSDVGRQLYLQVTFHDGEEPHWTPTVRPHREPDGSSINDPNAWPTDDVLPDRGGARHSEMLNRLLRMLGVDHRVVDPSNLDALRSAINSTLEAHAVASAELEYTRDDRGEPIPSNFQPVVMEHGRTVLRMYGPDIRRLNPSSDAILHGLSSDDHAVPLREFTEQLMARHRPPGESLPVLNIVVYGPDLPIEATPTPASRRLALNVLRVLARAVEASTPAGAAGARADEILTALQESNYYGSTYSSPNLDTRAPWRVEIGYGVVDPSASEPAAGSSGARSVPVAPAIGTVAVGSLRRLANGAWLVLPQDRMPPTPGNAFTSENEKYLEATVGRQPIPDGVVVVTGVVVNQGRGLEGRGEPPQSERFWTIPQPLVTVDAESLVDWPFHDPGADPSDSDAARPLVLFATGSPSDVAELARRMQAHIDERSLHGVEVPRAVVYHEAQSAAPWSVTQPGGLVLRGYSSVGEAVARARATVPVRMDLARELRNALRRGPHRVSGDALAEMVVTAAVDDGVPLAHQVGAVRVPVGPARTELERLDAVRHWLRGPVARVASDGEPAVTVRLPDGVSIPVVRLEQQGTNPEIHVAALPRDRGLWVNHYATGFAAVRLDHGVTLDELFRRLHGSTMDTIFVESGELNDVEVEHGSDRHAPGSLLRSASGGEWMTAPEFAEQLIPDEIDLPRFLVLLTPLGVGVRWEQSRFITQAHERGLRVIAAESFASQGAEDRVEWRLIWEDNDTDPRGSDLLDVMTSPDRRTTVGAVDSFLRALRIDVGDAALNVRDSTFRTRMLLRTWEETDDVEGAVDLDFVLWEAPSAEVIRRWLGNEGVWRWRSRRGTP